MNNELKVINCCAHPVSVFAGTVFDPQAGKSRGGTEILRLPPSGIVATATSAVEALPSLDINGIPIPTCKRAFVKLTALPSEGFCVVSSVYANAAKELGHDTTRLLTPYGNVIDNDGRIIGCTGLVRCA